MEWKNHEELQNRYLISEYGNVKNIKTNRLLKIQINPHGYNCINLWFGGKGKTFRIHRLVAKAFVVNSNNKPQINHKDGNKLNNHYSNLEWVTNRENFDHAIKNKLKNDSGENNVSSKLTEINVLEIRKLYIPYSRKSGTRALGKKYGVHYSIISRIISGHNWK